MKLSTITAYVGVQTIISYLWFSAAGTPMGDNMNFYWSILVMTPVLWGIQFCIRKAIAA